MIYDVAIIGAGPGGTDTAEYAALAGLSVVLFEKNKVGGVCLNEGCIPTKALLHSAHLYTQAQEAQKYGLSIPEVRLDYPKLMARKNKILRKLGAGIRQALNQEKITFVEGKAEIIEKDSEGFVLRANEQSYHARNVILATGSTAFIPPIEGLDEKERYWTAKDALESKELPRSICIIGGGVIGMEFASFFHSLGVRVSVVEMTNKILGNMDSEVSTLLQQTLQKGGVSFHLSTKVNAIRDGKVFASNEDGELEIEAEKILISAGRLPVTEGLGLEKLGIKMKGKAIWVDEHLKTSQEGIFAIGDVNGTSMLAHTAIKEGAVVINHIVGKGSDTMSYKAIPGVVYTDPEIASVGVTEEELIQSNIPYQVHRLPMTHSGRFVIENEHVTGLCKLLTTPDGILLGAHLLGNASSEILMPAVIAIAQGLTIADLREYVFPHPTICEILRTATLH